MLIRDILLKACPRNGPSYSSGRRGTGHLQDKALPVDQWGGEMQQASKTSVLTPNEACSLVYNHFYYRLDEGRRHRLAKYRTQFTATCLGSNSWHVFTWLAGLGQWNVNGVNGNGAMPAMQPVDTIARRLNWEFEQNSEETGHSDN
jgi:hypothetical protein